MDKRDFLSILIFMAGSDGKFSDDEVRRLLTFADRSGLSAKDVEQALADAADPTYPSPKPETREEAERLLTELLKIMAADGELHDMEKLIFSDLAARLGFDHDELKVLIDRALKKTS
jgi:tellurite resistance protein